MSWKLYTCIVLMAVSCLSSVTTASPGRSCAEGPKAVLTLLHMNDVYELKPSGGRQLGGLARVATLKKQLRALNPHTFAVLAGDLFSPSALGTAVVDGQRLNGRQMVDVMNHVGLDFATFGNHEFDLNEDDFLQRLQESATLWITSNVKDATGNLFPKTQHNHIFSVTGEQETMVRVGLFGLTLESNPRAYVQYTDYLDAARSQITELKPQVDILVAITHLSYEQDITLAQTFPELHLIVGGHEHENMQLWRGENFTPIMKADANAHTVYIHHLTYCVATKQVQVQPELKRITEQIPDDPQVAEVIDTWVKAGFKGFEAQGFMPGQVVATTKVALDGLESSVRQRSTTLTQLIAAGLLASAPGAQVAIFNGGSIRLDDMIPPGPITQYDIIRILPFGGKVLLVSMKGHILRDTLDSGMQNKGTGGYLQTAGVSWDEQKKIWSVQQTALDENATYMVAINDFLMTGREHRLEFLKDNIDVQVIQEGEDTRWSLIKQLQRSVGD